MEGEGEDFESMSVEQRLAHKSWKARLSAYQTLIDTFKKTVDESDSAFRPYTSNPASVREWVRDSNAVSQEKGVEAAISLVEWGGKAAARSRSEVVPSLVEKCLGSARAGTRAKAIELCLLYVEVEEDLGEGVITDLLPGLDVKQPKVVAGVVSVLSSLIRLYGPKTVSPKPLLKVLPKIFAHADKTVRAEGTQLALGLHAYLGPALTGSLGELKPVQQKELGEAFVEADAKGEGFGGVKQTRFTRSQQRERAVKETEETLGGAAGAEGEEGEVDGVDESPAEEAPLDPYEFAEPKDVLSSLPDDFYSHLSSSKWKDRKELALEPLLAVAKTPRIAPGNYDELTRALGGRMTDANVVCVALAANCIEALAVGLRAEFGKFKPNVMAPMLARTKEKKASVLDALAAALDAVFASVSISDITEDVTTFAKDKNPSVKAETIKFLIRSLKATPTPPPKADLQPLTDVLKVALEDSGEPVRLAAAEALGTLMKVVGERAMGGQVDALDELRKAKVKEAFEKAEVKCKNGAGAPTRAAAAPSAPAAVAKPKPKAPPAAKPPPPAFSPPPQEDSPPPTPKPAARGPPARLLAKKPPAASTSGPPAAPPAVKKPPPAAAAAAAKAPPPKATEPLKYKMSQEDAEGQAESVLPSPTATELADSNWKIRLAAIESLHAWLAGGEINNVEAELVVRFLSKKPGWKESNFQVSSKMFGVFQLLAEQSPSFAKGSAALSIPALSDKLGDIKLKKPAGDALTTYAEKTSLGFVLSQAYEPMTKQKAPKAQADSIVWVEQAIRDFGIAGLAIRELIEFLKVGLKSSNAAVRTSATKAIVTVRLYIGDGVSSFIQDLNPQLLATIEGEFAKVAGESPPEPTRVSEDLAVAAAPSAGGGGKGKAAAGVDPLDELFPRVDLEKLVPSSAIAGANDANWKIRKESLETIQGILEANKRLKPSNLSDLSTALKLRMSDSNKVVQCLALDILARIATGMGKPCDKITRLFATPVAGVLADAKANVRAAGTTTLSAMADAAGLDTLVNGFDKPLEAPNPTLRKELLAWLETRFADPEVVATLDLTSLAGPVIGCLEDKSADVRRSATALLPAIIARVGYAGVMDSVSKLKPASRTTVAPLIEAARSAAGAVASSAAPASAPASSATAAPKPGPPAAVKSAGLASSMAKSAGPSKATAKVLRPAAPAPPSPMPASDASFKPPGIRPRPSVAGLRKVAAAGSGTARSTPSPGPSAKAAPFKNADPDPKRMRASRETGSLRWVVDGVPRPDQVDALYQQMAPNTSAELLAQLFSKDHNSERDFVAALTVLDDCARDSHLAANYDLSPEELRARLVVNVDVIFKYITLRVGLTSTTITVKCLDLVDHLIAVLDTEGHKLSDYETSALLLSLINKVGDGKETIRQRVRAIFKSICSVYPFSKVFSTILDNGLVSKNARTRAESAEELGSLIQQHGVGPFPIAKALPIIAKLVSDRDASVRNAALTAIGSTYTLVGTAAVYKYLGPMPDKERTMVEERLKRTAGGPAPAGMRAQTPVQRSSTPAVDPPPPSTPPATSSTPSSPSMPPPSTMPVPRSKIGGVSRIGGLGKPLTLLPPNSLNSSVGPSDNAPTPRKAVGSGLQMRQAIPRPSSVAPGSGIPSAAASRLARPRKDAPDDELGPLSRSPTETALIVESINTSDLSKSAEALKRLQREITLQSNYLVPHADLLMEVVARQMTLAFTGLDQSSSPDVLRLCKHLMQTLTGFFDKKVLGKAVSTEALTMLLSELTGRLLDTADNPPTEAISSLSKVLNMVLIRIFHNSDQTACFSALFSVLQDATGDLRDFRGKELDDRAKYAELVMKCLWKVSKTVKESLEKGDLSPSRLLRDINLFLENIPPAEWRRRAGDNFPLTDMPLRTVKTILQQVVSVYGEQVFDHLDEIDAAENSFTYQYLFRLASSNASSADAPPISRNPSASSMSSARSTIRPHSSNEVAAAPPPATVESPPLRSSPAINSASVANGIPPSPGGADIEMNQRLKAIFEMIGDPIKSRVGIADLYEFQKEHPEAASRINTWMSGTGNYFQTYLRRALDNLAAADREKKPISRIRSTSSSGERPASSASSASGPGTPARASSVSSRISLGPTSNLGSAAKLEQLKAVFQ